MNYDEQQLINQFFDRISGKNPDQSSTGGVISHLPPVDPEADRLIADNLRKYPEAAYRMTQMAVVQEAALVEAQNRIRQLEYQLQQMQQQIQQLQQTQQNQQNQQKPGGGFLGGLFGGGNRQQPAQPLSMQSQTPPPGWGGVPNRAQPYNQAGSNSPPYGQQASINYPPGYQPGMFNRGGNGFLGSALSTAAGVAGGMMAYNALSGLFGGHHAASGTPMDTSMDPFASGNDSFAGSDPFAGGAAVDPNFDAGASDGGNFDSGSAYNDGFGGSGTDSGSASDWGDSGSDWGSGGGDDGGSWGDDSF